VAACTADGFFRPVIKAGVTIAVPVGTLPLELVEAYIDHICANPDQYAQYAGAAEYVAETLRITVQAEIASRR
jgi:hypothetical protein